MPSHSRADSGSGRLYGMTAPEAYAAGPVMAAMQRAMAAWDAADWDAYGAAHKADLVVVDHRPASLGSLDGRDAFVGATRVMREMFAAADSLIEQKRVSPHGGIAHVVVTCTDDTGRDVELEFTGLAVVRDGLIERMELFGAGQLDAAQRASTSWASTADRHCCQSASSSSLTDAGARSRVSAPAVADPRARLHLVPPDGVHVEP